MKCITETNIENKTVLLRCDLNVTIKNNNIIDNTKIISSLKTINYLLEKNNKIIILSHLGKIKEESDLEKNSLLPVYNELKKHLNTNIYFSKTTRGKELEELIKKLEPKQIVLVENTRYEDYPNKLESGCDLELSKYWASLCDIFVNDAFGTSHRCHASNYGVKKYVESYYGLLINEEVTKLDELLYKKELPFTVIMGGAKIDDKLTLINSMLEKCNNLILGGGLANTFIEAKGYNIGKSLSNKDYLEEVKKIISSNNNKIILPIDFYVDNNGSKEYRELNNIKNEDIIYDIGEKSIELYKEIINNSKTIFINGTVGLYENELYKNGTDNILKILTKSNTKTYVGGGDAVSSVNKLGYDKELYYLSTGGGATLEYIILGKLKALED